MNRHPEIALLNEPFHEKFATWEPDHPDFRTRLHSGEHIHDIFREILVAFRGAKEHTYHLDDDELMALVRYPGVRVLALTRTNVLEQAVSQVIAEQTNLWKTWDAVGSLESHYERLGPLDLDLVTERMRWAIHEVERLRAAVGEVPRDRVLHVTYETAFRSGRSQQETWLGGLWNFLQLRPHDDPGIWHFLGDDVRQARPSTYGRVPNLAAIEEELGDDRTGHLNFLAHE